MLIYKVGHYLNIKASSFYAGVYMRAKMIAAVASFLISTMTILVEIQSSLVTQLMMFVILIVFIIKINKCVQCIQTKL